MTVDEFVNSHAPPKTHDRGGEVSSSALTPEMRRFVEEYIKLGSVRGAAMLAGITYSRGQGYMRLPQVDALIESRFKDLQQETGYTQEKALEEAEFARQFSQKKGNSMALVKAVELKAKIAGLLIEKVDHSVNGNFTIQVYGVRDRPVIQVEALETRDADDLERGILPQNEDENTEERGILPHEQDITYTERMAAETEREPFGTETPPPDEFEDELSEAELTEDADLVHEDYDFSGVNAAAEAPLPVPVGGTEVAPPNLSDEELLSGFGLEDDAPTTVTNIDDEWGL